MVTAMMKVMTILGKDDEVVVMKEIQGGGGEEEVVMTMKRTTTMNVTQDLSDLTMTIVI